MNILSEILGAGNGRVLEQLGGQFGLDRDQTQSAIGGMLPALTRGMRQNMSSEEGLGSLLSALGSGRHAHYIDQPESLGEQRSIDDGNGILAHLLGGKEQSRQVASQAAQTTGLDIGVLKKMLPMLAGVVMGSASKQAASAGILNQLNSGGGLSSLLGQLSGGGSQLGTLSSFLDLDGDGSVADDLLGIAKKLF